MVFVAFDEAERLGTDALRVLGFAEAEAALVLDHLMDCELRGLSYAGLARILSIADRFAHTPMTDAAMRITRESPVSAQLDGADRIGYLVGRRATEIAVEKAQVSGLAVVGANHTWYTGMLSYYAEMITSAGMVAMLASNATPWVAPYGGTEPRFGTNPICFGFPSAGDVPVIWDIGISEIIHAQAVLANRTGRRLPPGSAYDSAGRPTDDPVAALSGAFTSWGGHRGSGLGIVVQLLGVLAGSPAQPPQLEDFGMLVLALRPDLFGSAAEFEQRTVEFAAAVRATRPADPDVAVRMPFERSAAVRAERSAAGGIEVEQAVLDGLRRLAPTA
ncbi:Ldh family oxidoreductase [Pseudonocardia alaniniphila]|uniref:Ldh family oxidoreductase n=1 Tax=Pseudonocardia alaniniphila TaxID=75291 RepID=A0ABS9TQU3_9PSEU|nr:Ldh family oxidoreductase [Pseudonocardia alaniniphila]MCH6170788.1 Ldh family oxidoreductase [Pseudonocardia alaniniphila]